MRPLGSEHHSRLARLLAPNTQLFGFGYWAEFWHHVFEQEIGVIVNGCLRRHVSNAAQAESAENSMLGCLSHATNLTFISINSWIAYYYWGFSFRILGCEKRESTKSSGPTRSAHQPPSSALLSSSFLMKLCCIALPRYLGCQQICDEYKRGQVAVV